MSGYELRTRRRRMASQIFAGLMLFTVSPAWATPRAQETPKDQAGTAEAPKGPGPESAKTATAGSKTSPEGEYGILCDLRPAAANPPGKYGLLCNGRTAKPAPTIGKYAILCNLRPAGSATTTGKYGILCDDAPANDNPAPQPNAPRK